MQAAKRALLGPGNHLFENKRKSIQIKIIWNKIRKFLFLLRLLTSGFSDLLLGNQLKVHKHEIFLNFFFTKIKSLYALRKFAKKILLSFLRFSPEFWSSNICAVTEHTRNQIFFERYPKKFFFRNLHYGPIKWVLRRFFQILIFYSRNLHFN